MAKEMESIKDIIPMVIWLYVAFILMASSKGSTNNGTARAS
jgi:hypothetical protein